MDVDTDVDANLLQQFSCLGTTDRDVLISQLQKLLGNKLNAAGCAFFLDMNNWNLQAAICSYFDYDAPKDDLPKMSFIKDITIGDGEAIPPNTKFTKTWRILNSGSTPWPFGCCLKFMCGYHLGHKNYVVVEPLDSYQTMNVSVEMVSPNLPGTYTGQWRMATGPNGQFFGETIWVILTVAEGGLLGLTQQMDAFNQLGSPPHGSHVTANPFASATIFGGSNTPPAHAENGEVCNPSQDNNQQENHHFHQDSLSSSPVEGTHINLSPRFLHFHCPDLQQNSEPSEEMIL